MQSQSLQQLNSRERSSQSAGLPAVEGMRVLCSLRFALIALPSFESGALLNAEGREAVPVCADSRRASVGGKSQRSINHATNDTRPEEKLQQAFSRYHSSEPAELQQMSLRLPPVLSHRLFFGRHRASSFALSPCAG